jgi:hypothetical protein
MQHGPFKKRTAHLCTIFTTVATCKGQSKTETILAEKEVVQEVK